MLVVPTFGLLAMLGVAAAESIPAINPNLFFNMTLRANDGFPEFSKGEWDWLNNGGRWSAHSAAKPGLNTNASDVWLNGPLCSGVYMSASYTPTQLSGVQEDPTDSPVQLSLDVVGTVQAPMSGGAANIINLGIEGKWHYCMARIQVKGIDFYLHNITVTTGMLAAASEMAMVPIRSQAVMWDTSSLNPFFDVPEVGTGATWNADGGSNVMFNTNDQPVTVKFTPPYSTGFFRLYGSVGPDHSPLSLGFSPALPGVPSGNEAQVVPVRDIADTDRLLFAAPLDPYTKYEVSINLRKGQVQSLSRVDFLSSFGTGNDWPIDPNDPNRGTNERQHGLGHRLSGGAIAGIVIGSIAAVALLAAAAMVYICRRKTRRNTQRWNDVKLRRMSSSLSPQVSPPRDVKTPVPAHIEHRPAPPSVQPERPDTDLRAEPRTPWPWTGGANTRV